jgi:ketosteroid isomerase-like protein
MVAEHPNALLVARFYAALGRRDAAAMVACYGAGARFSDPVFRDLDRAEVAAMWEMLCARGKDLTVEASGIAADDAAGRARWVATYTFSATGRRVVNAIDAKFLLRDGLIVAHEDRFDLYRWLRQAQGWQGALVGWLPPVQAAVRRQARRALAAWMARSGRLPDGERNR